MSSRTPTTKGLCWQGVQISPLENVGQNPPEHWRLGIANGSYEFREGGDYHHFATGRKARRAAAALARKKRKGR